MKTDRGDDRAEGGLAVEGRGLGVWIEREEKGFQEAAGPAGREALQEGSGHPSVSFSVSRGPHWILSLNSSL